MGVVRFYMRTRVIESLSKLRDILLASLRATAARFRSCRSSADDVGGHSISGIGSELYLNVGETDEHLVRTLPLIRKHNI